ncbi:MAG: RNA polymerase factor sigma-32 [Alphaproteobacteria bacterium]|nr:RNA polymerase factor sigma-32 [Alphaproteobacteria bacterium]
MTHIDTPETQRSNRRYIKAAMRAPLLSAELEQQYARAWRERGDSAALHRLVTAYMRLVVAQASRFRHYGLPIGDLIQEGNIGLMQAANRFEPERGVRFSTYASWWIRSSIQDFVLRNWSIVRTGTTSAQKALFFNLRRLRARIDGGSDRPLEPEAREKIARALNVSIGDVMDMEMRLQAGDRSLNAPLAEDGETEWQDILVDERPDPEATVLMTRDGATRGRWLMQALRELSPRERTIINERRLKEEGVTLEFLGRELGISKERVRQIEHQALRKLRVSIERAAGEAV